NKIWTMWAMSVALITRLVDVHGHRLTRHTGEVEAALAEQEVTNDLLRRPFLAFAAPGGRRGRTLGRVEAGLSVRHRLEAALPVGSQRVHARNELVARAGSQRGDVVRDWCG